MSTQRLMQFNPITLNLPLLLRGGISINISAQVCPLVRQRRSRMLSVGSAWRGELSPAVPLCQSRNPGSWEGESVFVC